MANNFNSHDMTGMFDTSDINENKVMSIIAYIPVLCLITIFVAGNSPFAKFHANQGIILTIVALISAVVKFIFGFAIGWIPFLGGFVTKIVSLVLGIIVVTFIAIGVINTAQGKAKKLPIIGDLFEFIK